MTRTQDLVTQIVSLVTQLQAEVGSATAAPIASAADLAKALLAGGPVTVVGGQFTGNFTIAKPTALTLNGATLTPADPLQPVLTVKASDVTITGGILQNGAPDRDTVIVGDFNATSADQQPARVTFDGVTVAAGPKGGHRAFALHGSAITVRNCTVTGFWEAGRDSQAIWIHNGPGPYTIEHNHLEASGETVLAGGDTVKIPNCVPSDIVIRGNTCFKPDGWRTNGATVKNGIEVKNGRRVLIENNTIDGNWKSGQDGTPIVLTVRNQNNDSPWVLVDDVTVRGNTTKRCTEGFAVSVLGLDDNYPSQQTKTITIEHNLFADSPNGVKVGNAVTVALTIRNNTLPAIKGNFLSWYVSPAAKVRLPTPLTFSDNVVTSGSYGIVAPDLGVGVPALQAYAMVIEFARNLIEKTAERGIPFPAGNTLVEPGQLAALLDSASFKVKTGTAGY